MRCYNPCIMLEGLNQSNEGNSERPKRLEVIDDFDSGKLDPRWMTRWIKPESLSITDELDPGQKPALKITVHSGDFVMDGGNGHMTERAEITNPEELEPGIDIWYGFSIYIPDDFEISDNRLVIAQWRQPPQGTSPSPFVSWRFQEGKIIGQVVDESKRIKFKFSNIEKGVWNRLTTNYMLDKNNKSHCQFIVNDDRQVYEGKMGYADLPKEKIWFAMGLYRDHLPNPQTLYFDKFRRGASKEFCDK